MEIVLFLNILGNVAVVYCGAIFLFSAGLFFMDRSPARKASQKSTRSDEHHEEEREDRRAA